MECVEIVLHRCLPLVTTPWDSTSTCSATLVEFQRSLRGAVLSVGVLGLFTPKGTSYPVLECRVTTKGSYRRWFGGWGHKVRFLIRNFPLHSFYRFPKWFSRSICGLYECEVASKFLYDKII